jgi:tRNA pseudouridine13 synthase
MLNKLVINPEDYIGALKELPKNLLTMFIYAYQSYFFNKILSSRILKNISINNAIVGDVILPIKNGLFQKEISVSENNIEKVNKQISKGKAFVSTLLFGSDTNFSEGEMGEIEHKIIDEENIDPRDFIIPDIPYLSSAGLRRPIFSNVKDLNYYVSDDKINDGKIALNLKFELLKGCYATSFLREIMKSDSIRNY